MADAASALPDDIEALKRLVLARETELDTSINPRNGAS
jgi:hypothetical protein